MTFTKVKRHPGEMFVEGLKSSQHQRKHWPNEEQHADFANERQQCVFSEIKVKSA